jgi:predicted enzyme related to lactoylglutathione lyase
LSGKFSWFDLAVSDPAAAQSFYADLLGWSMAPADGMPPYRAFAMEGDEPWAGVLDDDELTRGQWVPYVQVDDLDAATGRATALGARVVRDRMEGPAGSAVTIADPAGALLCLWVPR